VAGRAITESRVGTGGPDAHRERGARAARSGLIRKADAAWGSHTKPSTGHTPECFSIRVSLIFRGPHRLGVCLFGGQLSFVCK
jgi:hypothetical protein